MFLLYVVLVLLLLLFLFLINLLIIENSLLEKSHENSSSYECGFEHNSLSRISFSLRYFILTIVFLVFDIEVVLLVFLPFTYAYSYFNVVLIVFLFILFLVLGLLFEWFDGSLDWII